MKPDGSPLLRKHWSRNNTIQDVRQNAHVSDGFNLLSVHVK